MSRIAWNKGKKMPRGGAPIALILRTHNRKCEDCGVIFAASVEDRRCKSVAGGMYKCQDCRKIVRVVDPLDYETVWGVTSGNKTWVLKR